MKRPSPLVLAVVGILVVGLLPVLTVAAVGAAIMTSAAQGCADLGGSSTAADGWRAPMVDRYVVTSEFGPRYHPLLHVAKLHTGIDLVATGDTTIVAAAAGRVVEQRRDVAYGNEVVIDHGHGIRTRYAHMASPSGVHSGQTVRAGTRLGRMGATGYVTGAHLHFEVIVNETPVDPRPFMAARKAPLDGTPDQSPRAAPAPPLSAEGTRVGPVRPGRPVITGERLRNARIIAAAGRRAGVGDRGVVIALMTALQESGLRNLDYGDRDSLGLFQQRPSAGWGSPGQIRDPGFASRAFFGSPEGPHRGAPPGLLDIEGWRRMRLGDAAQAVQHSGFPRAYDRWESLARRINSTVGGDAPEIDQCESVAPVVGPAAAARTADSSRARARTRHAD